MTHTDNTILANSKEKSLVTVVIPTRNRPKQLQEALDSVCKQEGVGEHFEMEIIVVYDTPSDVPGELVNRYPMVRFIQQRGRGVSAARNEGIKAGRGKYVAFLDDDDLWLPHRLKAHVPVLETHLDVGVLYGQVEITGETVHIPAWPEQAPSGNVFADFLTRTHDFMHPDAMLVRREAFEKAGYFDDKFIGMEHYDLILRLAFHVSFLFILGPVGIGRFSKQGLWYTSVINGKNEEILPQIIERALSLLPETSENERVRRNARVAVCATIADQHWWFGGGSETVRAHLVSTLRTYPWMIEHSAVVEHVNRVVRELAHTSTTPVAVVREFWKEIRSALGYPGFKGWSKTQRLLGEFLAGASASLKQTGSPRRAVSMALMAIIHDPTQLRRKIIWSCFYSVFRRVPRKTEPHEVLRPFP